LLGGQIPKVAGVVTTCIQQALYAFHLDTAAAQTGDLVQIVDWQPRGHAERFDGGLTK